MTCDQTSGGVSSLAVSSGVAAFTGCAINRPGTGYVLEATAAGVTAGDTAPFNITWAGDTDGDCRVSVVDYSLVVTYFGATSSDPRWTDPTKLAYRAGLNDDLQVGVVDYSIIVTRFGTSTANCAAASDGNPHPAQ